MSAANQTFPEIPGVNVEEGLERLRGNAVLYKKLLLVLVKNVEEELTHYAEPPAEDKREELHAAAHKLKGASANLSAFKLSQAATAFDDLVRNPEIPFATALEKLPAYLDACKEYLENVKVLGA